MKLLLTKKLPEAALQNILSAGLTYDVSEALKITPAEVSFVPESDVWIISSRNSIAVAGKFGNVAPAIIYVVGQWMKNRMAEQFPSAEIKCFENMKLLAAALATQPFYAAVYFCADFHRDDLEEALARHPGNIIEVITHHSELTFPIVSAKYDAVFVFSPRSAESILRNNAFSDETLFVCIGPTTQEWLHKKYNFKTITASYPDTELMVREFLEYYFQSKQLNTASE